MDNLKLILADIIKGYSQVYVSGFNPFFVKHLTNIDSAQIEHKKNEYYKSAQKEGLPTKKELEEDIYARELWSKEKDKEVLVKKDFIDRLKITKTKLPRKSDIIQITSQIDREQKKLDDLETEKQSLFTQNCEDYSLKKFNEYYIFYSLRKDEDLKERYFTEEDFNDLQYEEIINIVNHYKDQTKDLNEKSLQKISLAPFFVNFFYLCENNPFTFYGKPVIYLTYYQAELFSIAKNFKHILTGSESRPPDEILNDPDKLLEWYNASHNTAKLLETKQENAVTALVGSKDDFEHLGIFEDQKPINLAAEAAKNGGMLTMQQMMELQGIKTK